VLLYPIYHPAAALYTPAMLKVLESDFARLPSLVHGEPATSLPPPRIEPAPAPVLEAEPVQLGLF
jgi:DNA polymerase